MKHSSIKSIVAVCVVCVVAASPAFARGKNVPGKGFGGGSEMPRDGGRFGCDVHDCPEMCGMGGRGRGLDVCLMGTVKSIDSGKSTVTVTDADGNDFVVHANPNTRICSIDRNAEVTKTETVTRGNKTVIMNRPEVKQIDVSELKKGDWVQVSRFNTNTTVIEAANILTVK